MKSEELNASALALSAALALRDEDTHEHSIRVQSFSVELGRRLKLSQHELAALVCGSLLHDVGKLHTSDGILHKCGTHNPAETTEMRAHAHRGAKMLQALGFPVSVVRIVAQHHERWDGSGYPERRLHVAIDRGARIVAVADTFDAITSNRCYRAAQSYEAARSEIERCRGTQFDPAVVDAFLSTPPDVWDRLRA